MVIPDKINSCIPVADRDDDQHHVSLAHLSLSGSVYVDKPIILHSSLLLGPKEAYSGARRPSKKCRELILLDAAFKH